VLCENGLARRLQQEGIRSVASRSWNSVNSELIEHYTRVIASNETKRQAVA
jgi:hypothetical protein